MALGITFSIVLVILLAFSALAMADMSSMTLKADPQVHSGSLQVSLLNFPRLDKSYAPEHGTFFLFFGGLAGMLLRFAQRSFRMFKRTMDYMIALTATIVAAPIFLLIAVLVKTTSKGPIFYRQCRVGKDGCHFMILKFRSMCVDAEKGTGAVWAKANDPRLTPVGNFLRKSHLDELPQLINVLKGEMSIVGPRPERPEIVKDLQVMIADYDKRLYVLPGITGLAQVMNRYDETITDVRRKVKYDILYIKKMCWLVEMRVLALTCLVMLTGKVSR